MKLNRIAIAGFIFFIVVSGLLYKLGRGESDTKTLSDQQQGETNPDTRTDCEKQLESQPGDPVEKFEGTPKQVDFTTLPDTKNFYTVITEEVAKGANFAGHFTLATWGCGTDCLGYAVIDTRTGKIVSYAPANEEYHLGNLNLESRFFVLEPVHAGQERKFYMVVEDQDGDSSLDLACTEISTQEMYSPPR